MALAVVLAKVIGKERLSTIREVSLMHRDLAPVVPDARPGDKVVILVHGFCASAGVFRPLAERLKSEADARIASFTHAPGAGVRRIARSLAALVERIPQGARITIVGHSLGGVVARWYVQEMGGDARVERTISLGSPFGGVDVPRYLVGTDLHEESALLRRLRDRAAAFDVPHTSVVAMADRVVPGIETACLGVGDVVVLEDLGHNSLLFDPDVAGLVIDRVRGRAGVIETVTETAIETVTEPGAGADSGVEEAAAE
jgi:pimeloyl-ACP methyl ester carboxylesterase